MYALITFDLIDVEKAKRDDFTKALTDETIGINWEYLNLTTTYMKSNIPENTIYFDSSTNRFPIKKERDNALIVISKDFTKALKVANIDKRKLKFTFATSDKKFEALNLE